MKKLEPYIDLAGYTVMAWLDGVVVAGFVYLLVH